MKTISAELSNLLARQSRLVKEIKFIENALKAVRSEKHKLEIEKLQIVHSKSRLKSASLLGSTEGPDPTVTEYNMDDVNMQKLDLQVAGVNEDQNNEYMLNEHSSNYFPQSSYTFDTENMQPCSSHGFVNNYGYTYNDPNPGNVSRHPNICPSELIAYNQFYM